MIQEFASHRAIRIRTLEGGPEFCLHGASRSRSAVASRAPRVFSSVAHAPSFRWNGLQCVSRARCTITCSPRACRPSHLWPGPMLRSVMRMESSAGGRPPSLRRSRLCRPVQRIGGWLRGVWNMAYLLVRTAQSSTGASRTGKDLGMSTSGKWSSLAVHRGDPRPSPRLGPMTSAPRHLRRPASPGSPRLVRPGPAREPLTMPRYDWPPEAMTESLLFAESRPGMVTVAWDQHSERRRPWQFGTRRRSPRPQREDPSYSPALGQACGLGNRLAQRPLDPGHGGSCRLVGLKASSPGYRSLSFWIGRRLGALLPHVGRLLHTPLYQPPRECEGVPRSRHRGRHQLRSQPIARWISNASMRCASLWACTPLMVDAHRIGTAPAQRMCLIWSSSRCDR